MQPMNRERIINGCSVSIFIFQTKKKLFVIVINLHIKGIIHIDRSSMHMLKINVFWHVVQCIQGILACCYIGYFGYAWLHKSEMIVSTYGTLWHLPACKKWSSFLASFLKHCKNNAKFSGSFGNAWPNLSQKTVLTCRTLWRETPLKK